MGGKRQIVIVTYLLDCGYEDGYEELGESSLKLVPAAD
jgi:hypothetical protein